MDKKKVKYINPDSYTKPLNGDKNNGGERVRPEKVDYTKFEKGQSKFKSTKSGDGYSHMGEAVTKGDGSERVRPEKVDYTKFEKGESKFKSTKAGDGYDHMGPGKSIGSKGEERVRKEKVDYTKFEKPATKKNPFKN